MGKGQINKYQLDQWLKDYHWMVNEIKIMKDAMESVLKGIEYDGAKIAQYGIEATLPKAVGGTSDPVSFEAIRRANIYSRYLRYERKVREIQERSKYVVGEREIYVLNCILDGDSMRKIGQKMGLSESTIRRLREHILDMMIEQNDVKDANDEYVAFDEDLKNVLKFKNNRL